MYWINSYQTPEGPHYSRPYETREAAIAGRVWFEGYLAEKARALPPHTFTGLLQLKLKDPVLAYRLRGGPKLFRDLPARPPSSDGYVDATEMLQAAGKRWGHYWQRPSRKRFAAELAAELGIPVSDLVRPVRGGHAQRQGTWVHPRVAENLRAWIERTA